MDALNLVFGLVTVASSVLALIQYMASKSKDAVESERIRTQQQRIRSARYTAISAAEALDFTVQRSKDATVTHDELRNLCRVARGQLRLLVRQMEIEDAELREWQFGRVVGSQHLAVPLAKPNEVPKVAEEELENPPIQTKEDSK